MDLDVWVCDGGKTWVADPRAMETGPFEELAAPLRAEPALDATFFKDSRSMLILNMA